MKKQILIIAMLMTIFSPFKVFAQAELESLSATFDPFTGKLTIPSVKIVDELGNAGTNDFFQLEMNFIVGTLNFAIDPSTLFPTCQGTMTFNACQTERMRGQWRFVYTVIDTFSPSYLVNDDLSPSSFGSGTFSISVIDELGNNDGFVRYNVPGNEFVLRDDGTNGENDRVYLFQLSDDSNSVSGCAHVLDANGNLGTCFPMTGTRL